MREMRVMAKQIVHADDMSWVLDPGEPFLGPVRDGGVIVARTSPGCWGPMITPDYPSGHEVTKPIAVDGAEVGDAIAVKVRRVRVLSLATTSGTDLPQEGHFIGDPFVAKRCPNCGTINPKTYVDGVGEGSIKCTNCHSSVQPFRLESTYTVLMDVDRTLAVTVPPEVAGEIAKDASSFSFLPPSSKQYSANLMARGEIAGIVIPLKPMVGNLGTCPAVPIPSSHNAGDFGVFLVGAPHEYALTEEQLEMRTDGHMDINEVVEGSVVICPVKVEGGGIYVGDVHAMMGDGEIAGHTADVSAEVVLEVSLIKGLKLEGPMILPRPENLPQIARLRTPEEIEKAKKIAAFWGFQLLEESLPIQMVGTGKDLNAAVECALSRISKLFDMPLPEVRNRCTITGEVNIGRLPGVVNVTMLVPRHDLESHGLWNLVRSHYLSS